MSIEKALNNELDLLEEELMSGDIDTKEYNQKAKELEREAVEYEHDDYDGDFYEACYH